MSVCAQMGSPQAAGLFERAIIQSGLCESPGNAVTLKEAESRNAQFAKKVGCAASDLGCLRKVDPAVLMKTKVPGQRPISNLVWSPTYGTGLLPMTLEAAFTQGKFNHVPVLAGTNHDEGRLFVAVFSPEGKPISKAQYWIGTGLLVGALKAPRVLRQYTVKSQGTPALAFATMFTDGVFSCPAMNVARSLSRFVPTYAYEFNDPKAVTRLKTPGDLPGLGSFHSSSLVYALQTPVAAIADPAMFSPEQRRLSDGLSGAWMNFVKTGDPNGPGAAPWRRFDAATMAVEVAAPGGFRETTGFSVEHKCGFWDGLGLN